jgi:glycosyltransferase involved in cell wall biosynthesis
VGGGVESAFSNLVTGLAALQNVEPTVVTFVPEVTESKRGADGVEVHYLPASRRLGTATLYSRERRILRQILHSSRPDVVHAQDTLRDGYVCLRTQREAPVVVSVHGIVREEVKYAQDLALRMRLWLAAVPMEAYCIRHASYLAAPNRYAERYFGNEIRGTITDVGNPLPERLFAVEPAPEPGCILFSGALMPRKSVGDLVDAFPRIVATVPEARLHIAGGQRDSAHVALVRRKIDELDLRDRVTMLGQLGADAMLEEYRRASVLALPSRQESSPMAIGEAMAVGVPVVATRVGGIPDLVEDGVTGHLVEPGDVVGLATRIADVLRDPAARAALGAAGRARANERYRPDVVARRVRSVYETAVTGHRG